MVQKPENVNNLFHFWVSSGPFFSSTLFLHGMPQHDRAPENLLDERTNTPIPASLEATVKVFDCDGSLSNEVKLNRESFSNDYFSSAIELEPLLEGCKLESGMKHSHLEVSVPNGINPVCRINTREGASIISPCNLISSSARSFFPVGFGPGQDSYLCLVNCELELASVRVRLFLGKRSPETAFTIPGRGSRVTSLGTSFAEYLEEDSTPTQGYLRLSSRNETTIGVQLIERRQGLKEGHLFSAIA